MKKSQLQSIIREEVKAALREDSNPELDNLVSSFVKGLAKRNGYGDQDALFAIFDSLKRLKMLGKDVNYRPY